MYGYPNSVGIIRISLDLIRYEFVLRKSNLMFNFTPKVPVGRPRQRDIGFLCPFTPAIPCLRQLLLSLTHGFSFPQALKALISACSLE